jgi:hypothetical protein
MQQQQQQACLRALQARQAQVMLALLPVSLVQQVLAAALAGSLLAELQLQAQQQAEV